MRKLPNIEVFRRFLNYDAATGILTWRERVSSRVLAGSVAGGDNGYGYIYLRLQGVLYPAHRIAWILHHGHDASGEIDHVNGVRSDNRLSNLRCATKSQNQANRAKSAKNPYPKGVSKERSGFRASIASNGQQYFLGRFGTPEEAHRVYMKKARELFGEFASSGERAGR